MNLINKTFVTITDKIKGDSLKARASRGAIILTVATFIERLMRLVRNMVLARLLAPEDFGLMAIVMAVLTCIEAFTDVGVRQSVIQNKAGAKAEYLNIAWWFQAVRGLGLFVIAFLGAPAICSFYDKPELLGMLRVSIMVVLFSGLISPRLFVLEKEFRFLKVAFLVHGSALLGALLTISLALYMQNVWVLVIGYVGQSVLTCFLSHVLCPFRPNFTIDRNSFNEILRFCRRMLGLSFLTVVSLQTDVFVLGKLVPTAQVGMYALALSLALQPVGMFGQTINRVLLPAFAEKQDDRKFLRHATLKLIRTMVAIGVPLVAIIAIFAGYILSVVYGSRYAAVAVPFGILCASQLFRIQACILAVLFLATGQPHLQRRYVILLAALIIGLIYPGVVLFGLAGAAGVILLANAIGLFMQVMWIREQIGLRFLDYACCWLPGLLGCTVVLATAGLMQLFGVQSLFCNIAVVGLSCIPACVIATFLLKPKYSRTYDSRKNVEKLQCSSSA